MKVVEIDRKKYRLPNSLNRFQEDLYIHLINWKWEHNIHEPGMYTHKGKLIPYDAILPESFQKTRKTPLIYKGILAALDAHQVKYGFRIHLHFNHMASSQAANINLFLPILLHPLAGTILQELNPSFHELDTDDLDHGWQIEYSDGIPGILNDKSGTTGTDSDLAIAYRNHKGKRCLWLIEHKLTEAEFTECGGRKSRGRKPHHDCSRSFTEILKNKAACYYHDKCGYRYWDITDENRSFFVNHAGLKECPFQRGMNQLWRNQLLALALKREGRYEDVHFSVVRHPENSHLERTLNQYRDLINNNPAFSVFTSSEVIQAVERHADSSLKEWIGWYRKLYKIEI